MNPIRPIKNPSQEKPITLLDRLALAFLSGLLAFLTACLLWLALAGINSAGLIIVLLPKEAILWFTGIMAFFGFIRAENLILEVCVRLWRLTRLLLG